MGKKVTAVRWSHKALNSLQMIYDFYAEKSVQAAENVTNDICDTAESIVYRQQYQTDEYHEDCRRMVCRHFKILYQIEGMTAYIINVFDTRSNPQKEYN